MVRNLQGVTHFPLELISTNFPQKFFVPNFIAYYNYLLLIWQTIILGICKQGAFTQFRNQTIYSGKSQILQFRLLINTWFPVCTYNGNSTEIELRNDERYSE